MYTEIGWVMWVGVDLETWYLPRISHACKNHTNKQNNPSRCVRWDLKHGLCMCVRARACCWTRAWLLAFMPQILNTPNPSLWNIKVTYHHIQSYLTHTRGTNIRGHLVQESDSLVSVVQYHPSSLISRNQPNHNRAQEHIIDKLNRKTF